LKDTYLCHGCINNGHEQPEPEVTAEASCKMEETPVSTEIACPAKPCKPLLYAESAEGFGPWRIYVSERAANDIREREKADAKIREIVINKLR
jgi:hypothetical protein